MAKTHRIYILIFLLLVISSETYSFAVEGHEQEESYYFEDEYYDLSSEQEADDALFYEKDLLNARLVAEVETLRRENEYLQQLRQQKQDFSNPGNEAFIEEMEESYDLLFRENKKIKKALISLDNLYKRDVKEIAPLAQEQKRLETLANSQWVVIAEREKIVADLKAGIDEIKTNLDMTKQQSEQEKTALRLKYTELVRRLEKELFITKEEKQLLVDSYTLLEKRHKLTEEKLQLWQQSVSRLIDAKDIEIKDEKKSKKSSNENADVLIAGLDNSQDSSIAYAKLAIKYTKQEQYQQAIKAYKKAIAISPEIAVYNYQLGLLYAHLKQNKKAINAFNKYLELSTDSPNRERVEKHISLLR